MTLEEAKSFTGNPSYWGVSGEAQLQLLKDEGLKPEHHLLEVGCGSLNAGIPLIEYLDVNRYAGIEPKWELIEATKHLVNENKNPIFVSNQHFDVSKIDRCYDYIIGHSVFSHAPEWQLIQCLHNLLSVIKSSTKIYFSLHFGSSSGDVFWKDKGNTFYELDQIEFYAYRLGYDVLERRDIKETFMRKVPVDYHDWVQFIKK